MNMRKNKPAMAAVGAGLLVLVFVAAFPFLKLTSDANAQAVPKGCATSVTYYATQARAGSHNFGPDQQAFSDKDDAMARFKKKMCTDPLFAAVQVKAAQDGQNLDASATQALAREYVRNHSEWKQGVHTFLNDIQSFDLKQYSQHYETLGMVPHGSKVPSLVKMAERVPLSQSLDITLKDGTVLHQRIHCDFQLSAPTIPHVPTPHVPPQHSPGCKSDCGGCTSHCSPPPGCQHNCTTCTHNCTPPHKCNCVTPQQATQNVPTPPPGDPNAPKNPPAPHPTVPVDTNNPPPPSSGGYNGGSPNQPGQSGTPDPVVPSSDPTNVGDPGGF